MATLNTFICDVCGMQKKDTNHWWLLFIHADSIGLFKWEAQSKEDALHLCSESCAVKKISEFMGGKSCVTAK